MSTPRKIFYTKKSLERKPSISFRENQYVFFEVETPYKNPAFFFFSFFNENTLFHRWEIILKTTLSRRGKNVFTAKNDFHDTNTSSPRFLDERYKS